MRLNKKSKKQFWRVWAQR